ncbi:O-methyltransferase family 3 protein [Mucidula mucida]|nr:O-methyltransferase family 3 protein [Mucidula mucida]
MPKHVAGIDPTARPTTVDDWEKTTALVNSYCLPSDPTMEAVIANTVKRGMPAEIAVPPEQGKLLELLVKTSGARRILEVGRLAGMSVFDDIHGTRTSKGRQPDTLEISEAYAEVARENIDIAGLSTKVKVVVGAAAKTLADMTPDPPFDFVFIDADKKSNAHYYREAKRLVRQGGIIIVDNMMLFGQLLDPDDENDNVCGVKELLEVLKDDTEVECTTIGTASEKGFDGFLYAIRK